jgi:hypothetical protein
MKTADQKSRATNSGKAGVKGSVKAKKLVDDFKLLAELIDPSVDQIKKLAEALYQERIERGEEGSPHDDWHRARQQLCANE